jgi:hypothetical protein
MAFHHVLIDLLTMTGGQEIIGNMVSKCLNINVDDLLRVTVILINN